MRKSFIHAAFSIILGSCPVVWAGVYYVSPSGHDDAAGLAPNDAWRTLGRLAGAALKAGDEILLERGGVWREMLVPPVDGLVFGAYGNGRLPVISGADPVGLGEAGKARLERAPVQVFLDGVRAQRVAADAEPGAMQWQWREDGLLHVGGVGEDVKVLVTNRDYCVDLKGRSGITLRGLRVEHAGLSGIRADTADRFTIEECEITGCYVNGIRAGDRTMRTDVVIGGNVISDCGGAGIGFGGRLDRWLIEGNEVIACGVLTQHIVPFGDGREAAFAWTAGIKNWGWGGDGWQGEWIIRHNVVRDCVPVSWAPNPQQTHGNGIWADEVLKPTARPLIHGNRVFNCYSRGIYLEKTDDHDVYDNVVTGCAQVRFTGSIEAQSNPFGYDVENDRADDNVPRQMSGNQIFHNTTWGGWWTFSVSCSSKGCSISDTLVRDNLFVGNRPGRGSIYLHGGGANDGVHGTGNQYLGNGFGQTGSWVWGGTVHRSVADLEAAAGGAIRDTLEGRPEFEDPATGDFRLRAGSVGSRPAMEGGDAGARGRERSPRATR